MAKYVDSNGLKRVLERINKNINDAMTNGLHSCKSCGAPYIGKPTCQYCGRAFFADIRMYTDEETKK